MILATKPLHKRSGFFPTIGSVLILVAGGLRSGDWIEAVASSLVVVGLFLQGQRSKSVAASDVVDVVNSQVEARSK